MIVTAITAPAASTKKQPPQRVHSTTTSTATASATKKEGQQQKNKQELDKGCEERRIVLHILRRIDRITGENHFIIILILLIDDNCRLSKDFFQATIEIIGRKILQMIIQNSARSTVRQGTFQTIPDLEADFPFFQSQQNQYTIVSIRLTDFPFFKQIDRILLDCLAFQ